MNIIVVKNGQVTNLFTNSEEDFIVLESGTLRSSTMREISSKPVMEAESIREIVLTGGVIAKHKDFSIVSGKSAYFVEKGDKQESLGDGVDMFSEMGVSIQPGTLLFQANALPFLQSMDEEPEMQEMYGL
jgi:hypothetical protein